MHRKCNLFCQSLRIDGQLYCTGPFKYSTFPKLCILLVVGFSCLRAWPPWKPHQCKQYKQRKNFPHCGLVRVTTVPRWLGHEYWLVLVFTMNLWTSGPLDNWLWIGPDDWRHSYWLTGCSSHRQVTTVLRDGCLCNMMSVLFGVSWCSIIKRLTLR